MMSEILGADHLLSRAVSKLPHMASLSLLEMFFLALVVLLAPLLLQLLHSELMGDRAKYRKLPGPKPILPLIGSALAMPSDLTDVLNTFHNLARKFRGFYHLRLWEDMVIINTPEVAETLLNSSQHINKAKGYNALLPWLGEGLLTSSGDKWRARRKMLTPAFHFKILEQYLSVFNEQSDILVEKLRNTNGQKVNIFPFITKLTLDIISEAAMGVQIGAQQGANAEYMKAVNDMSTIVFQRFIKPWLRKDSMYRLSSMYQVEVKALKILHGFTDSVISARKKELAHKASGDVVHLKSEEKKRKAFMELLLASTIDGKPLSDKEIRDEVDTFMFEGHDTTSSGINWTLYNLGRHPEVQAKAYSEVCEAMGEDMSGPITRDHLAKMTYLGMVIKESLRLFPSVPMIGRRLVSDIVLDGYAVPKSCMVGLDTFSIHRDPRHWPDPERFDPERFTPENSRDRHPYSYVPFSAGPRNCIGQKFALMEERTVIANLLRSFEIKAHTKREDLKLRGDAVLRLDGGLWLSFIPRH